MTEIVRIVPRQPIEAEIGDGEYKLNASAEIHWESTTDTPYAYPEGWVEVSDPIVWDGTDEALEAIRAAFEGTANYASRDDNPSAGWGHSGCLWVGGGQQSSLVPPVWRIRIEGDSFVILPPEATS